MKNLRNTQVFNKVYGIIMGGAVGDALGGPLETMHYRFIRKLFNGRLAEMTSYRVRPADFSQAGTGGAYALCDEAGTYTDDTRLASLISNAIVRKKGRITADDLAETWMTDMKVESFWHSISSSYFRIAIGQASVREGGVANMPDDSSAMCIGPIGAINFGNPAQAALDAYDVASLSHDGYSREAASMIAAAVAEACKPNTNVKNVVDAALSYLPNRDTSLMRPRTKLALELADKATDTEELTALLYQSFTVPWTRRDRGGAFLDGERLSQSVDAAEAVPCALAMFYKSNGGYKDSVLAAANFGRDCDTIACMTGYIAGAFNGANSIPYNWIDQVKQANPIPDLENLALRIVEALCYEKTRFQEQALLLAELKH